ncbi:MAG: hypothetical protein JWM09_1470, partial [Francisellaceae bacterium]|nr:hypothetical protein [Francisellaceae bacterium]
MKLVATKSIIYLLLSLLAILISFFKYSDFFYQANPKELPPTPLFSYWKDANQPTLIYSSAIFDPNVYLGDVEVTLRALLTAKKMGWNVLSDQSALKKSKLQLKKAFGIVQLDLLPEGVNTFPKDIPLVLLSFLPKIQSMQSPETYFSFIKKISYPPMIKGYMATTYYPINSSIQQFKNPNKDHTNNINFIMNWYPSVQKTHYRPNPKELMYVGGKYGGNLRSEQIKYQQ